MFDPVVHEPVEDQPDELDPRWVLCRRPSIVAGGELQRSMLDLTYEPRNGVYLAPIQMQANNGVLVIDDFGRQLHHARGAAQPLDRAPRSPHRLPVAELRRALRDPVRRARSCSRPTSSPAALGDEAFFRRIQNKILVPTIARRRVRQRAAPGRPSITSVELAPGAEDYLRQVSRELGDGDLRPYLPNEVCKILKSISAYFTVPRVLNKQTIDRIAALYFTHAMRGAPPPSLLTTLVQQDEKAREPGSSTPPSGVQHAGDPETAQLQRRQQAQAAAQAAAGQSSPPAGGGGSF